MDQTETQQLIAVADRLADAARLATLKLFRSKGLTAQNKLAQNTLAAADGAEAQTAAAGAFDPVTQADRAAETAMRDILTEARPRDAILGEEFAPVAGTSGLTWVLDPIDGTRGYMSGTPTWGVLVAVSDATGPIYGVIDQPYIGERFSGGLGRARFAGPHGRGDLCTRGTRDLSQALIFSTYPEVGTEREAAAFRALGRQCRLTRYGMDCYAYALLALGQIDLVVEAGLQPYDIAAPIAVIEAAGGVVTDWQGRPAHGGGRVLAAANATLHAAALEELAGAALD
ncbi:inositol monophosphatase family protein [Brevirhabdus sp.]|uniref:inositol monophosphatase family protein n=1 Tax=Brevirhabdus sp. TaxID=2004514 RepID=UPI004059B107